jgi:hypothetical protein
MLSAENIMRKKFAVLTAPVAAAGLLLAIGLAAAAPQKAASSRAYVGHENDADIGNFIRAYPKAAGTRLDDCQACHRAGVKGTDTEREFSPCGYCHLLVFPNSRYATGVPKDYAGTLNPYGMAYKNAGRTVEALAAIAQLDSDGDGSANGTEVGGLRYPGDPASRPGQPLAPFVSFAVADVRRLAARTQFMLMNTTKEPTDDYVTYTGVRVADLLAAAGVDLEGVEGVTVFAPDGYSIDYSLDDITRPFPAGYYYAGPAAFAGADRSFVKYPGAVPPGVVDGKAIPGQPWLILAFEREGKPLDVSTYEKGSGRLAGEGPFRLVKPQRDLLGDPAKPGRPDRAQRAGTFGDGWDFSPKIDHNAGACVRGACVIRVNPVPAGFEEYDWKNGWPLVAEGKIVVYGRGVKAE